MADKPFPDILYKYRIWDRPQGGFNHRIITEKQLYFASPSQFNDPFDCALPFRYDPKELTDDNIFLKYKEMTERQYPEKSPQEIHEICYKEQQEGRMKDPNYWKDYHPKFQESVDKSFGIVSLTSKPCNLLMWSHYANSHQGFCVGLDANILYEIVGGGIGHVFYDDKFPYTSLFDDIETIIRHLNTKSILHWEYEDEYRITKNGYSKKTIQLPSEVFKEVIIGCKCPESIQKEILATIEMSIPNANVYLAKANQEEFKIDVHKTHLL